MKDPTIAQVDAAVRAVLASRGDRRGAGSNGEIFPGRLLGESQAEQLAAGTLEIAIAAGTIITPLARLILKRRNIAVRIVAAASLGGEWGLAIDHASGLTAAVRRALTGDEKPWIEIGRDVHEAAYWLANGPQRGAALLTDSAAVTAWRANGIFGIRAAVASEAEEVARAIRTLGANLLVIEPPGKSIFGIRHLLKTFQKGGPPVPPLGLTRGQDDEDRRGDWPRDPVEGAPVLEEPSLRDRLAHAAIGPGRRLGSSRR